jgi:4-amino-4-deoxy-L-arabinose transferase-like glycosyltransferase
MPDPMMVAFSTISIYSIYQWEKKRTVRWAVFTGLATGFTIFSKSLAGIILVIPFAVFILSTEGLKNALKNRQVWLILILSALPIAAFTYYGFFIDGRMADQFIGRFFPNLYTSPSLYVNWFGNIETHFGLITLILSVVGLALVKEKKLRTLLISWWAGYIVYGFIFPHHISTHSYYHLPLVPIMAVSLTSLASRLADLVNQTPQKSLNWGLITAAFGIFVFFNLWSVKNELNSVDYRLVRERLEHIGGVINASPKKSTVALTDDYEASLRFYGMISSRHWPSRGEIEVTNATRGEEAFEDIWREKTYGVHFFVVLDMEDFDKQPELKDQLYDNYEIADQGEGYILFDLLTGE